MNKKHYVEDDLELTDDLDSSDSDIDKTKKRERRGKTKEQKIWERKVVFWTLLTVLLVTFAFWILPIIGGGDFSSPGDSTFEELPKKENFVKYDL